MRRRLIFILLAAACMAGLPFLAGQAEPAQDSPRAASASAIAGLDFDDPPLALPVAPNFRAAMQSAAVELGLNCGAIESYGWRMAQTEQQRVNNIFTTIVDRLRAQGYVIAAQNPASVAADITVFTARRPGRQLLVMWSAGELGLVLLIGEAHPLTDAKADPLPLPPPRLSVPAAKAGDFTPHGIWAGSFTCAQHARAGTLTITAHREEQIEGMFRFDAAAQNAALPKGAYRVAGRYDPATKRVLLQPGAWIEQSSGFDAAPIIGSFDAAQLTFTGIFQGIVDCGKFEAYYVGKPDAADRAAKPAVKNAVKKSGKKTAAPSKKTPSRRAVKQSAVQPATGQPAKPVLDAEKGLVPLEEEKASPAKIEIAPTAMPTPDAALSQPALPLPSFMPADQGVEESVEKGVIRLLPAGAETLPQPNAGQPSAPLPAPPEKLPEPPLPLSGTTPPSGN